MTAQSILQYLQDDVNNAAEDAKIWRAINSAVVRLSESFPWSWLRRRVTVTTTDDATQGFLMPADMVDVLDPIDDGNGIVYKRLDSSQATNPPTRYSQYYFFDAGPTVALAARDGVSIDKDSTALTFSPALVAGDHTGEFIRLTGADGEDWGVHQLASNTDLVNAYRGKRISGGYYILRPTTTKRISFTDYTAARIGVSLTANYWAYPTVLLSPWQELPTSWEEPLRQLASIELTTVTYDKKTEGVRIARMNQYEAALAKAQLADGKPPMQDLPRDNTGRVRSMGWRR